MIPLTNGQVAGVGGLPAFRRGASLACEESDLCLNIIPVQSGEISHPRGRIAGRGYHAIGRGARRTDQADVRPKRQAQA